MDKVIEDTGETKGQKDVPVGNDGGDSLVRMRTAVPKMAHSPMDLRAMLKKMPRNPSGAKRYLRRILGELTPCQLEEVHSSVKQQTGVSSVGIIDEVIGGINHKRNQQTRFENIKQNKIELAERKKQGPLMTVEEAARQLVALRNT
jgi:hypothetical protein